MSDDNCSFNGKGGVFQPANIQQREDSPYAKQKNRQPDADRVINKLAGDVH